MATLTERLAILVEANADQAIATIKGVGVATQGLAGDAGKAGTAVKGLGSTLGSIVGAVGPQAALAAAGVAVAKFAASGVTGFVDLANEVRSFQNVAGGTTEDASKMVAAFSAVGVSTDTAATGIFQLEKHLNTGAAALAQFGVVAVKDAKGNTDMSATLANVAAAYQRLQDPVQKAALLTDAFGKSGTALVPLLAKSRQEIQAFYDTAGEDHKILSQDDLNKAKEYSLAIHNLHEAWTGLEEEAGQALVPFLTSVANAITDTIHLGDEIGSLIGKLGQLSGIGGLDKALGTDKIKLNPLAILPSIIDHFTGSAKPATAAATGFADELGNVATAIGAIGTSQTGFDDLSKAIQSDEDATRSLTSAQNDLTSAQAALNKLQKDGAVDTQKVADAQRSLDDATRSVGHAQREQTKAQDAYNKAVATADILGTDTSKQAEADAANNLADANDAVASAQEQANKAAVDLAAAKAGDPNYQQNLADAKQKVAVATQNVADKSYALVTAQQAESSAVSDNADQVQRLLGYYEDLIAKHPEVAAAVQPLIDLLNGAAGALGVGPALGPPSPPSAPAVAAPAPALGPFLGPPKPAPSPFLPTPLIDVPGFSYPRASSSVNNITVNTTNQTDPLHVGRQIAWQLN